MPTITTHTSDRYSLVVMDYTVWQNDISQVVSVIQAATSLAHQNTETMLLVLMPQPYSGLKADVNLKRVRLLEDKLMAMDMDISRSTVIFNTPDDDLHASDNRRLIQDVTLAVSGKLGQSSWAVSFAMRGKIGPVKPLRAKDFAGYEEGVKLSPIRRLSQRGAHGTKDIIDSVVSGMAFDKHDRPSCLSCDYSVQPWCDIVLR
jgi:hypothetical protein